MSALLLIHSVSAEGWGSWSEHGCLGVPLVVRTTTLDSYTDKEETMRSSTAEHSDCGEIVWADALVTNDTKGYTVVSPWAWVDACLFVFVPPIFAGQAVDGTGVRGVSVPSGWFLGCPYRGASDVVALSPASRRSNIRGGTALV